MKAIPIILILLLFNAGALKADWTEAKVRNITEHLQDYRSSWTIQDTQKMLDDANGHAMSLQAMDSDVLSKIEKPFRRNTAQAGGFSRF